MRFDPRMRVREVELSASIALAPFRREKMAGFVI
jgi:hypothetical protein